MIGWKTGWNAARSMVAWMSSRERLSWTRDAIDGPSTALAIEANSTRAGRRSASRSDASAPGGPELEQPDDVLLDPDRREGEGADVEVAEFLAERSAAPPRASSRPRGPPTRGTGGDACAPH